MTFYETLTAAVADLSQYGFDSIERLDQWTERLRRAAEESLMPPGRMEELLRENLSAVYKRLIDNGGILKSNNVPRFTIERLKPELRAELQRRIMASAQLIKLNRTQAIESTLRRFQGWASSIPPGGSGATDRVETKTAVRKSLARMPFEQRRVIIDQSHKLTASLSQIIATNANALAAEWRSNWRQAGYNYRPDHKERDRKIYLLKGSWALERGFIKPGEAGYLDDITKPAEEPMCRCTVRWLYNLRDIPSDMLTQNGKDELDRVRAILSGSPLAGQNVQA